MVVGLLPLTFRRLFVLVALVAAVSIAPAAAYAARPHGSRSSAHEVIVQFERGVGPSARRAMVRAVGARVVRDLHVIRGLGVHGAPRAVARLARMPGVRAVTRNTRMRPTGVGMAGRWAGWNPAALSTAFVESSRADKAWTDPRWLATGTGVAVAVLDTGIAGDLPDFRSEGSTASRVLATAVTSRDATTASDGYGHGTHVAGLIAGNGRALAAPDPLFNRYLGTAPSANLVSVKVADDHGDAYLMDVIEGLQFVVDRGGDYGVRVINLSLGATESESYRVDPLDAAVEAAWMHGFVVVAAAGNRGTDADAVSYAPANDPYVITVGAVDDHATKDTTDDSLAPWSSRGITQDGYVKPDLVAPGAHIVGPLAPGSDYASLCPTCVVAGRYFRVGGTSMSAPIVAGIAADIISAHPEWTPNQVKGALTYNSGTVDKGGEPDANLRMTADGAWEVAADLALNAKRNELSANVGLVPSEYIDPATGDIDTTRASWRRASWRWATDGLRASWGAASWTVDDPETADADASTDTDPLRASWRRASWRRASWRSFFGDDPSDYGELSGGSHGRVKSGR